LLPSVKNAGSFRWGSSFLSLGVAVERTLKFSE
jgi:hypothetical protein